MVPHQHVIERSTANPIDTSDSLNFDISRPSLKFNDIPCQLIKFCQAYGYPYSIQQVRQDLYCFQIPYQEDLKEVFGYIKTTYARLARATSNNNQDRYRSDSRGNAFRGGRGRRY